MRATDRSLCLRRALEGINFVYTIGRVSIGYDEIRVEEGLILEDDSRRTASSQRDLLHRGIEPNLDPDILQEPDQAPHDRRRASHREVNPPLALEPVDQEIDRGRPKGIAADQQRLKGEHLPERVVFDVVRHETVEASIGSKAHEVRNDPHHVAKPRKIDVGELGISDVEDPLRVRHELPVAVDVGGVELRDLREQTLIVPDVVERSTVREHNSIERVDRDELEVVCPLLSEQFEQLIKQIGRGDHRWPGIEVKAVPFEGARASTRLTPRFDDRDAVAHRAKPCSRGQPSEAGPDHHRVLRPPSAHAAPSDRKARASGAAPPITLDRTSRH